MKENGYSERFWRRKPSGLGFKLLNARIKRFGYAIGNTMRNVISQARKVSLKEGSHF